MGRQDVRFWQDLARREGGPVLELGCGTGRLTMPVARTGARVVGVDRSRPMLAFATVRRAEAPPRAAAAPGARRHPAPAVRGRHVLRSDGALRHAAVAHERPRPVVDAQPRPRESCATGRRAGDRPRAGPAGVGRIREPGHASAGATSGPGPRDAARVGPPGQAAAPDAVRPGVRGPRGDRRFARHRFSLAFRTLPLAALVGRVEKAGFRATAVLGDYRGRAWDLRADVWLILAQKR